MDVSAQAGRAICLSTVFPSIQALQELDDSHLHCWGWTSLLSLLIQMLNSFWAILMDIVGNNVLPALWVYRQVDT